MASKSPDFAGALQVLRDSPLDFSIDVGPGADGGVHGGITRPSNGGKTWSVVVDTVKIERWQYLSQGERYYTFTPEQVLAHEIGHALAIATQGNNWDTFNGQFATQFENKVMKQVQPYHIPRNEFRHHDGRVNPFR